MKAIELDVRSFFMNIGIVGAGAIANFLFEEQDGFCVKSVLVTNKEKYATLAARYNFELYEDVAAFLQSDIELVVEAATIEAVQLLVPQMLHVKPVIVISIGAFADELLLTQLYEIAEQYKQKLYLPSGAVGGLDLLQNAHVLGQLKQVKLTTTKPASSLTGELLQEEKVIFEGIAAEAIARYPKNMNVSIVIALASLGICHTQVKLIASPFVKQNIHTIFIQGDFGEATIEVKNNSLPTNPKTSYLAAMSVMGTIKKIQKRIVIG